MGQLAGYGTMKEKQQLMYDVFPQKITDNTNKVKHEEKERTSITGIVNVNRSWGCWGGTAALAFRYFFFLQCEPLGLEFPVWRDENRFFPSILCFFLFLQRATLLFLLVILSFCVFL